MKKALKVIMNPIIPILLVCVGAVLMVGLNDLGFYLFILGILTL